MKYSTCANQNIKHLKFKFNKNPNRFVNQRTKICNCNVNLVRNLQRIITMERTEHRTSMEELRLILQTERKNCNKFLKEMQILIDDINFKIDMTNQQLMVNDY